MTQDNQQQDFPEVVVMYYLNDEDNGDIFFTPEEFKEIFQFQPNNEKEYYVLRLYKVSTEEGEEDNTDSPEAED